MTGELISFLWQLDVHQQARHRCHSYDDRIRADCEPARLFPRRQVSPGISSRQKHRRREKRLDLRESNREDDWDSIEELCLLELWPVEVRRRLARCAPCRSADPD